MLRDVMQNAELHVFAEVSVVIFCATFALVALRTLFTRAGSYEALSRLPLDQEPEVRR